MISRLTSPKWLAFMAAILFNSLSGNLWASSSNDSFYHQPTPLLGAKPGTVIKFQRLTNSAALPHAAKNILVMYHSRSISGHDIAVTGTIAIPRGTPPPEGWPVTTWGHGTTGIGPACAPSQDTAQGPEHYFLAMKQKLMDDYVKNGYVVAATDYEGFIPPKIHLFLQGESEGRGIIDIVRAARLIDPHIGSRYVIIGHSQGGHADLFAAALAPSYAGELQLLGNVAMAPASHIATTIKNMIVAQKPSFQLGYTMYVLQSFAATNPQVKLKDLLSPEALLHLAETKHTCITDLVSSGYWASTIPRSQFKKNANFTTVMKIADKNDPRHLKINVPTLIVQGDDDDTVLREWTDTVVSDLCKNLNHIYYTVYPGATHETIPMRSKTQVQSWVRDRFKNLPAANNCKTSTGSAN